MFNKLNSKLEWLFDHDSHQNPALDHALIEAKKNYISVDNNNFLENISYIFNDAVGLDQMSHLASRISCYFEMVFLCQRIGDFKNDHTIHEAILYGKKISGADSWPRLRLPKTPVYKVFRTSSYSFLSRLNLAELDPDRKLAVYSIKLSDHYSMVVVCRAAEPWIKLKIETLQHALMKINFKL